MLDHHIYRQNWITCLLLVTTAWLSVFGHRGISAVASHRQVVSTFYYDNPDASLIEAHSPANYAYDSQALLSFAPPTWQGINDARLAYDNPHGLFDRWRFGHEIPLPQGKSRQVIEQLAKQQVNLYLYDDRQPLRHDLVSQDRTDNAGNFEMSFYSYDGLGSVRGLTDAIGTSLGNYHYDAYGLLIENTVTVANPYLFAGERYDSDLGLYYLRARFLDVETGRMHSLDSYEGSPMEASSLHKYLYSFANPVSYIDPSGHFPTLQSATAAITSFLRWTIQGVSQAVGIGAVVGGFVGSQSEIGVIRGAYYGAMAMTALHVGYRTGRLPQVALAGLLNAVGSVISHVISSSVDSDFTIGQLLDPIFAGFSFGAIAEAVTGSINIKGYKVLFPSFVAASSSIVGDMSSIFGDWWQGNRARFSAMQVILRATGAGIVAAIANPRVFGKIIEVSAAQKAGFKVVGNGIDKLGDSGLLKKTISVILAGGNGAIPEVLSKSL